MALPTVTALEPSSGPAGIDVIITGTNFLEDTTDVKFGTVSCDTNYVVVEDTKIVAFAPVHTGTVNVYVTTSGGTNTVTTAFTYATYEGGSNSAPTIISPYLTPSISANSYGEGGDDVQIDGTNLSTTWKVLFGGRQALITAKANDHIHVTSPPGVPGTTVEVEVYTNYGSATSSEQFSYPAVGAPTITSIAPAYGNAGTAVVIQGNNYATASGVAFGDSKEYDAQWALLDPANPGDIVAIAPEGPTFGTTVHVWVANDNGWCADPGGTINHFTYKETTVPKTTATGLDASPNTGWAASTTMHLSASYDGGSVGAIYYTYDGGSTQTFSSDVTWNQANGQLQGSHVIKFWAVGNDGTVEPAQTMYANLVWDATRKPAAPTGTPGIGVIHWKWAAVGGSGILPYILYKVYCDTSNPPTTLVATTAATTFDFKTTNSQTTYYCGVKSVDFDGIESGTPINVSAGVSSIQTVATEIADDAITFAKLAPGLQPPVLYTGASLPASFTDYPAGSLLYWVDGSPPRLYRSTGSSWVYGIDHEDIVVNSIEAGQIKAGAIGATEIAADSIFAKQLVVADFENLVMNANSELALAPGLSLPVAYDSVFVEFRGVTDATAYRGSKCRQRIGTLNSTNYIDLTDAIPVRVGASGGVEENTWYHAVAWAKCSTDVGSLNGAQIRIVGMDKDGNAVGYSTVGTLVQAGTWTEVTADYQVPAGTGTGAVVAVKLQGSIKLGASTAGTGYYDDILFRRKNAGNLIVDGTLSANAINGGTITGAMVTASTELRIGSGGKLTTGDTGERIEINNSFMDEVRFIIGVTNEIPGSIYAYDSGAGGELYIEGPSYSGGAVPYFNLWQSGTTSHIDAYFGHMYLESDNGTYAPNLTMGAVANRLSLYGNNCTVDVGYSYGTIWVTADKCHFTGGVEPPTYSTDHSRGILIQDSYTTTNKWHVYVNGNNGRLFVYREDAGAYWYYDKTGGG